MNKLSKILLWLYFLPFFFDLVTALVAMYREGHTLSETNPIFILFGGNLFFFLLYLGIVSVIAYYVITYEKLSDVYRYFIIVVIVFIVIVRISAIASNVIHIIEPVPEVVIEQSVMVKGAYSTENKLSSYGILIFSGLVLPILAHLAIFRLFKVEYMIWKKP